MCAICYRFNLPEPDRIGQRFSHQATVGQLQRAMVAMEMACNPDLIDFDEPTTALDITTQIEVLATIKVAIRDLNSAVMHNSHNLAVVLKVADRIMVLRNGDLVEEGGTRTLLATPGRDYTRTLLAVRKGDGESTDHSDRGKRLFEVSNVTAAYVEGVPVLRNIGLEVTRSKMVAVVGESGSAIALALAAVPELIVRDEITSALNQLVAPELLQRLQNGLGVSYLFITHDLATVKVISDELVVMLGGRVVEHGTIGDILKPPHHEYTEVLPTSVPELDPEWLDNLLKTRIGARLREGPASGHARQADG